MKNLVVSMMVPGLWVGTKQLRIIIGKRGEEISLGALQAALRSLESEGLVECKPYGNGKQWRLKKHD